MTALKLAAALLAASLILPASALTAEEPAGAETPGAAASGEKQAEDTSIKITLDELRELLKRGETPRIALHTKYTTVTGMALRIEKGQLFIDVTGEQVAVAGVLGTPASFVEHVEVLARLSEAERQETHRASMKYLQNISREPPQEAPSDEEPPAESAGEGDAGEAAPGPEPELADVPREDLLEKYPPSEGWGPEKAFEITRKRIVLGLNPFGKDKTFLQDYDEWKAAYNAKRAEQIELQAGYEKAGEEPPEDFEVWAELGPVASLEGEPWGKFDQEQ